MDEKSLLTGVLTKTLNMTDEEIAALLYTKAEDSDEITLNEDALDLVLDRDVKRIDNVKQNVKPDKDRLTGEYNRGVKETMEKFEQQLKAKYSIESASQGLDLVQEAVDTVTECNTEVTDDKVKAHPLYRALEEKSVSIEDHNKVVSEYDEFKSNIDKSQRFGKVKSDALNITNELKPIYSENPTVAKTRQEDYLRRFEQYDYEIKDDGNHFVMKDGKRIEDVHGNPVKFNEHVASIASTYYDFQVSDDKGQSGNKPGSNGQMKVVVPKDEKEYLKKWSEYKQQGQTEEAIALTLAWEASQNK